MALRLAEVLQHCVGFCYCVTEDGRSLSQEEVHCFLFVAAAVARRAAEVKSGGIRAKEDHRSIYSSVTSG